MTKDIGKGDWPSDHMSFATKVPVLFLFSGCTPTITALPMADKINYDGMEQASISRWI